MTGALIPGTCDCCGTTAAALLTSVDRAGVAYASYCFACVRPSPPALRVVKGGKQP